jgi:hypothetical protein
MPATEEKKEKAVFAYDVTKLQAVLAAVIQPQVSADAWSWLQEKAAQIANGDSISFNVAFSATPRRTGKQPIAISEAEAFTIQSIRPGFTIRHWTIDRLSRVWLILHLDTSDRASYMQAIERLFPTAEMGEQVALYSALPVLAFPEAWRARCAEGIRSNIADVLEAIMCDNPYAAENLDEPAWNQLVLKAIFTEKPIHRIIGLDARANQNLANTLSDYAHERWAASRRVLPMLWRCVGNFINDKIYPDIQRIATSEITAEREAAALTCAQSSYEPARALAKTNAELSAILQSGLTWNTFAQKLETLGV